MWYVVFAGNATWELENGMTGTQLAPLFWLDLIPFDPAALLV
jgi:hypothetical protein